jgi:hypothetical protein
MTSNGSKIAAEAEWCIGRSNSIHYREIRPIQGLGHRRVLPITVDCSGFVTVCFNWAGAPDPNGNKYGGQGYTGTLLRHGGPTTQKEAKPGDLVIFGAGTGNHVALVTHAGANPILASHGGEAGPIRIDFRSEYDWQKNHYGDGTVRWRTYLGEKADVDDASGPNLPDDLTGLGNRASR